jgi:hypothetical protein
MWPLYASVPHTKENGGKQNPKKSWMSGDCLPLRKKVKQLSMKLHKDLCAMANLCITQKGIKQIEKKTFEITTFLHLLTKLTLSTPNTQNSFGML